MNKIKELREREGLTQSGLSHILQVSKRSLIYWENGEKQMRQSTAERIADYFNVSVGYLLGYSDDESFEKAETNVTPYNDEMFNDFVAFLAKHRIQLTDGQIESMYELLESFRIDTKKSRSHEILLENTPDN